jgi:hypothetical protein
MEGRKRSRIRTRQANQRDWDVPYLRVSGCPILLTFLSINWLGAGRIDSQSIDASLSGPWLAFVGGGLALAS